MVTTMQPQRLTGRDHGDALPSSLLSSPPRKTQGQQRRGRNANNWPGMQSQRDLNKDVMLI